jgi:hypothetical protein
LISERIAALAQKIEDYPDEVNDYNEALEVVAMLLDDVIQSSPEDSSDNIRKIKP